MVVAAHQIVRVPQLDASVCPKSLIAGSSGRRSSVTHLPPVLVAHGDLVGFAAQAKHVALYTIGPGLVASTREELAPYNVSGVSSIRFTSTNRCPRS